MALVHLSGAAAPQRRRHPRWLTLGAAALLTAAAIATPGVASAAPAHQPPAGQPDFGPNVKIFDPTMPTSEIQATVDAIATQQVDNEMGTQRYALLFKPGTYGTADAPADLPGRLLHRGRRPRPVADRRHHQRPRRRLQPVPDPGQLHRAGQLLALAVEPDDQRRRRERLPGYRRVLGRVAGGADAAGQGQRQPHVHGLLHRRPAVRQRRLHRRLRHRHHHQRLAAAVPRARQQHRQLVERRLEPGLRRRAGRAGAVLPEPAVHHAGHHPGEPGEAVPVRRRAGQVPRLRARRCARTPSGTTWPNGPTPGRSIPLSDFYLAKPSDSVHDDQPAARRGART